MDQEKLLLMRGDVIEKSIKIENLIAEILTRYYFGILFENARPFMRDVLKDEWFSFGLKTKILKKILDGWIKTGPPPAINLPSTLDLKGLDGHLRGISDYRNLFAHREESDSDFNGDPQKTYEAFKQLYEEVKSPLETIRERYEVTYPSTFQRSWELTSVAFVLDHNQIQLLFDQLKECLAKESPPTST